MIIQHDVDTWEEILDTLFQFKIDAASKSSVKGLFYLNKMLNKNIKIVRKKIEVLKMSP